MSNNITVVISNYAPRGNGNLLELIKQIQPLADQLIIVVNDDKCKTTNIFQNENILYITRENTGMNIGAWSAAIPFCKKTNITVFLQDECRLLNSEFIHVYDRILKNSSVGMIGESMNNKWNHTWDAISESPLNYKLKLTDGSSISRVDYYKLCLRNWKIDLGQSCLHLRALAWAFNPSTLHKISRFPTGHNKEQCIAAEIGVSKIVEQLKLDFLQTNTKPFTFFEHAEWRSDGFSKK